MNEPPETGFARRCPFPVGSWGLQNRPCPPPPLASWEGNWQPSALPAPNAPGSLGTLLAEEQRAPGAGGNSPRHELAAAGDSSWGDAQIDRQIALPSPAPAPTFPTRLPPGRPRPGGHLLLSLRSDLGPLFAKLKFFQAQQPVAWSSIRKSHRAPLHTTPNETPFLHLTPLPP